MFRGDNSQMLRDELDLMLFEYSEYARTGKLSTLIYSGVNPMIDV